ncbi:DUF7305 domain-containing protein [Natronospora cellulosivora (SeqCode)]
MINKILNNEEGSSLLLLLVVILVITILGVNLSRISLNQYQNTLREEKRIQSYYIAKSGANLVASAIENNIVDAELINSRTATNNLNDGFFSVHVEHKGNNTIITSTGTVDDISTEVSVELSKYIANKEQLPIIDHAVFADSQIELAGAIIKGDLGIDNNGIDKNGNIKPVLKMEPWSDPIIEGNIFLPAGWSEDSIDEEPYEGWADKSFHGDYRTLDANRDYVLPEFPEFPTESTFVNDTYHAGWHDPSPPFNIHSSKWYDKMLIDSELIIHVYDDDINIRVNDLEVNGEITVKRHGEGNLNFYVDNDFKLEGSGSINKINNNQNNNHTDYVNLYYAGNSTFKSAGRTEFHGNLFVDNADIKLIEGGGIMGNIVTGGRNFEMSGGSSANVQAIYAPNAHARLYGGGTINGAIITESIFIEGGTSIEFNDSLLDLNPEDLGFEIIEEYTRTWR